MEKTELAIDRMEVLRYLGYRGHPASGDVMVEIERAAREILQKATPRYICRTFDLERKAEELWLAGTQFQLEGSAIAEHLASCDQCVLLAATLGYEIEVLLSRTQVAHMTQAIVMDCCASSAIESFCDQVETLERKSQEDKGHYLTGRFSPGYGDFPLSVQRKFCDILDTQRKIGLYVSQSGLLIPRKSVTAILGISGCRQSEKKQGCAVCSRASTCQYRKDGIHCGEEA